MEIHKCECGRVINYKQNVNLTRQEIEKIIDEKIKQHMSTQFLNEFDIKLVKKINYDNKEPLNSTSNNNVFLEFIKERFIKSENDDTHITEIYQIFKTWYRTTEYMPVYPPSKSNILQYLNDNGYKVENRYLKDYNIVSITSKNNLKSDSKAQRYTKGEIPVVHVNIENEECTPTKNTLFMMFIKDTYIETTEEGIHNNYIYRDFIKWNKNNTFKYDNPITKQDMLDYLKKCENDCTKNYIYKTAESLSDSSSEFSSDSLNDDEPNNKIIQHKTKKDDLFKLFIKDTYEPFESGIITTYLVYNDFVYWCKDKSIRLKDRPTKKGMIAYFKKNNCTVDKNIYITGYSHKR
jgi:hypothetical protein